MKKLCRKLVAFLVLISLFCVPVYADEPDETGFGATVGTYVGTVDLGNGFVGYEYISYVDSLSAIQPCSTTLGSGTKYTDISYSSSFVGTIRQTATFTYGSPDAVVRIKSVNSAVNRHSTTSIYTFGTLTNSYTNGSPAVMSTRVAVNKNGSYVGYLMIYMYCKDSGLVS